MGWGCESGFRIGRRSESTGGRSRLSQTSAPGDSSDEGVIAGRRREVFYGEDARTVREMDSKEFQPDAVDETRCRALLLNRGYGKLQCRGKPVRGCDLCAKHSRRLPWGRVTGALSQNVLSRFWRTKLKGRQEDQQWYSRSLMWRFAVEQVPGIEFLKDLSDEQYANCLDAVHRTLEHNKKRDGKKYQRGAGVRSVEDRSRDDKYGNVREQYNGVGGGQVFKWYTRPVFLKHLRIKRTSQYECTERQCMESLRETSEELKDYPALTARLTAHAGPQCFPHIDGTSSQSRLHANELRLSNEDGSGEHAVSSKGKVGCASGMVMSKDSWFQCCNLRCKKWRCVDPAVADMLRGVEFLRPEATDLDWCNWLGKHRACHRYCLHRHRSPRCHQVSRHHK